jgi:hypothetical protein
VVELHDRMPVILEQQDWPRCGLAKQRATTLRCCVLRWMGRCVCGRSIAALARRNRPELSTAIAA